jgi:hypothetical protein
MFLMNNSLLKASSLSAHHFCKPTEAYFAGFEKITANSKAFGAIQLRTY